jgi:signal transduction histidine kinase
MQRALVIIISILFSFREGFSQIGSSGHAWDSLKHKLPLTKNDTSRVLLLADIASAYGVNNIDSLNAYGRFSLALSQKIQFSRGEVTALNVLGVAYQLLGEYPKSLEYFYRALEIAEKKNYDYETAICYEWIGGTYWFLTDYSKAIDFYQKSIDLFKVIPNDTRTSAWIRFNIMSIGQAYLDWNRPDSAHDYLLQYFNATQKDEFWHPYALYLLGDCLFQRGDRDTSFQYLRKSIAAATVNKDYFAQSEACAVLSRFFKTIIQNDSAIYYAKMGLAGSKGLRYKLGAYKNIKLLAEEYEQLNALEALHYRKMYDSVNDDMYGSKKVQELQKTLAEEQRRQQISRQAQTEKENRIKQYGFIGGLVIMLIIASILYANNQQKKKANDLLQKQKLEIENTLARLKTTQAQLVQSEKMASLGELTAGIAHEIQNPLNFVNNFSEVNAELIAEAKTAIGEGKSAEAMDLLSSLNENQEKINQHGKRADAIVKGMLLHSRGAAGQKEPTDINALVDEYLRLSYHGFRAKNRDFNATINTHFEHDIVKVDVIAQDIGRVLQNIFYNALYAVSEKKKRLADGFTPNLLVQTAKSSGHIEIRIKDNGYGIPEKIKEKIFQPFFTTKPAGQGTGLGLSLAYDIIVKEHGGSISFDSREGEYTEFFFRLPLQI